jgi:hypothetical protein
LANPFRERSEGGGREFLVIPGHGLDLIAVRVVDGPNETTLLRLTVDDDGAALAPLEHEGARVESESGLLLLGPVTAVAMLGKNGTHLSLEKLDLG